MDGLPASQIFVNCPGKANTPWAGACNNSIPFAILCTTTGNAGKWYRKCTQCGYYEWVEPSATGPSDSCPTTVPPYATQPPRQYPSPPPSQAVSGGASFQQFDSTTSSQYASQQPAPQAIASAAQSGICANVGCTRRWTATTCSKRMCKACCIAGAGGCTCKSHAKPRVFSTSSNPFHLSRPLPTIPYDTPQASIPLATESSTEGVATAATSASPSLPGPSSFEFSKPADESFLREFKRLQEQRARRNAQDKTLMAYKARIKHAVVIVAFLTPDLESPVTVPVQGIATWPTFNLVDVPDILSLLSVSSLDELNLFDPKLGIWLTRVDHVMEVTQNQAIYVRHDGVKTSLGDLDSSNPLLSSLLSSQAPSATRKRIMHESPYPMTPAKVRRVNEDDDFQSSPPHPSSPMSIHLSEPDMIVEPDNINNAGNTVDEPIIISSGPARAWPGGERVCDMAKGFERLVGISHGLPSEFEKTFPGVEFKSTTYQKNRRFWLSLPQSERLAARENTSTWVSWRKTQPTWKSISCS